MIDSVELGLIVRGEHSWRTFLPPGGTGCFVVPELGPCCVGYQLYVAAGGYKPVIAPLKMEENVVRIRLAAIDSQDTSAVESLDLADCAEPLVLTWHPMSGAW